jgi:hypothetical protein
VGALERPSSWQLLLALRREHPRFGAVMVLLLALFVGPLFLPSYLPFVDWGARAGELAMVANWGDQTLRFAEFHRLEWWHGEMPLRLLLAPLVRVAGADLAMRLVLALCFVAQPLLIVSILRRRQLSPWAALLTFAALHSYPLHFGHLDYVVSLTLALAALASWEKRRDDPGWRPVLIWAGWALGCAVAETQGLLVLAVLLLVLGLLAGTRDDRIQQLGQRLGRVALALAPGVAYVAADALRLAQLSAPFEILGQQASQHYALERIVQLPLLLGDLWRGALALGIASAGFLLLLVAPMVPRAPESAAAPETPAPGSGTAPESEGQDDDSQPREGPARAWLPRVVDPWLESAWVARYRLAAALVTLAFLLGPSEVLGLFHFPTRLPVLLLLLLPLVVGTSPAWRSRIFIGAAVAWALWLGVFIASQLLTFGVEVGEMRQVIAAIPRGSKVRCLIPKTTSTIGRVPTYRHFCGHVQAQRGGVTGFVFRSRGVHLRAPYAASQEQIYREQDAGVATFDHATYGDLYDYFIVRPRLSMTGFDRQPLAKTVRLLLATRNWRVYRRVASMKAAGAKPKP